LAEKNPEINTCFMDLRHVHSSTNFLDHFATSLLQRFPSETSGMKPDHYRNDVLRLPDAIAKKNKIKIALFVSNAHQFHRFKDAIPFLRMLKLMLKHQKDCVFCFYGNNHPHFRELLRYPGPLSGFGQLYELKHNPSNHRSAWIRKLFHDYKKRIGYKTSVQMSLVVDNHPFYLKLLAWHALMLTNSTCTPAIVEKSLNNLLLHFDYSFNKITETLTPKQLIFLKALVEGNHRLYSRSIRDKYQLGSTSNIARIRTSLENKEIIYIGQGDIGLTDPIFREWLRERYFGKPKLD